MSYCTIDAIAPPCNTTIVSCPILRTKIVTSTESYSTSVSCSKLHNTMTVTSCPTPSIDLKTVASTNQDATSPPICSTSAVDGGFAALALAALLLMVLLVLSVSVNIILIVRKRRY